MKTDLSKQPKQKSKSAQKIREEYENGERNFSGFDLRDESFAKSNLSGANFSDCDLRGTDFTCCNLSRANFSECDLKGTNFTKARLVKAILHDIKAGSENDETKYN